MKAVGKSQQTQKDGRHYVEGDGSLEFIDKAVDSFSRGADRMFSQSNGKELPGSVGNNMGLNTNYDTDLIRDEIGSETGDFSRTEKYEGAIYEEIAGEIGEDQKRMIYKSEMKNRDRSIQSLFTNEKSFITAFIFHEVLEPPLALRKKRKKDNCCC